MFDVDNAVLIGGFIILLISILLSKIFDGILVVCCCQKQVDSLGALARSIRLLLEQIGELYHIPWTEELDRADSLIEQSATVSSYNFKALYDISSRSTCLISEICNKLKVLQLVAASAAEERGCEQWEEEEEARILPLPHEEEKRAPCEGKIEEYASDSTSSTFSNRPTPINLHLHLHSPSLPQKPKEEEHEEEKPTSGGPEDKKNEEKKRGNKFEKREKERENKGKKEFSKGKKRENREEEEEERIAPLPHEEEKAAPSEGKIEEYESEEENLGLSSYQEEPLPISSPTVSLSNEEIPPQTLPSVISSPTRRRRGGIGE